MESLLSKDWSITFKVKEINLHIENTQKELDSQIESIKQRNMVIHPT